MFVGYAESFWSFINKLNEKKTEYLQMASQDVIPLGVKGMRFKNVA